MNKDNTITHNLLLCKSPLQMMIAEKIMEIEKGQYDTIVLVDTDNIKHQLYANRLKNKSNNFLYFSTHSHKKVFMLVDLLKFYINALPFMRKKYDTVFLSNINTIYLHLFLSKSTFATIKTFDDGIGNIYQQSGLIKNKRASFVEEIFRKIFNIKYTEKKLLNVSEEHYTIYPGLKNIFTRTKSLKLIDYPFLSVSDQNQDSKPIKIFLGQPLSDILSEKRVRNLKKKLENEKIDYYFPHPRDTEQFVPGEVIHTNLIFEEYLKNTIAQNNSQQIILYTVFSTAALNLIAIKQIKVYCYYDDELMNEYKEIYDLFSSMGATLIQI